MSWKITMAAPCALLALGACATVGTAPGTDANALHRELFVLDTHLDTPINFGRAGWNFAATNSYENDVAQVDLGRMKAGNLDGGFFVIFTSQGPLTPQGYADALAFARTRSGLIDAEIARHPQLISPATTASEAEALNRRGQLVAFKAMKIPIRWEKTFRCWPNSMRQACGWRGRCTPAITSLPIRLKMPRAGAGSVR
jgi:membrane dipeptidase